MVWSILLVAVLAAVLGAVGAVVVVSGRAARLAEERRAEHEEAAATLRATVDEAVHHGVQEAIEAARRQAGAERDAAVEHAAALQRQQLDHAANQVHQRFGDDLSAKKELIDARLDQVHGEMRAELNRLADMVTALSTTSSEKFGEVASSLQAHAEVANTLAESTRSLREALSNPQTRGQWGERMAEDVLRLAGFQENVNYRKQSKIEGGAGRPDYTFPMPKDHVLYMDVKFPMAAYLKYLESNSVAEREAHLKRFLGDVRLRVKELAKREYASDGTTAAVDYVLLFIPNEQLTGFIHEHDPELLDHAMGQKVVMCSPLTLFAFLGVIRQAFDNFMIEQTSDEILSLLGTFGTQWRKYVEQVEKVQRRFEGVDKEFEALAGTRRRALERPLLQLEALRLQRGVPVDGELFSLPGSDEAATPPGGSVRRLGA